MKTTYPLRYKIEPGNFSREELGKDGGCDQILFCSYMQGEDGSGSYAWLSSNGKTPHQEMGWSRKMHCWATLTKMLAEAAPADCPNQKLLLENTFEAFRLAVRKSR